MPDVNAKPRPRSVLQVLPALVTGGVERGAVDIAKALVAAGWQAFVASSGGPLAREIERAGGTHITLPMASKNPYVMYRNFERLVEVLKETPIGIVHARSRAPAWSACAAARQLHLPFVTTFHGTYNFNNAIKRRYNSIMAKGDVVIAISEFISGHVHHVYGVPFQRIRVVPRGIDLARFDPQAVNPARVVKLAGQWRLPDGVPVVMLPGRLARWKGHSVLLAAIERMQAQSGRIGFTAVLVGDDQGRSHYSRELKAEIEKIGGGAVARLVGHCDDMPAAYMLSDVVVSASTDPEGFGRVAVEAQAMQRPIIATDHGGSRETVIAGRTGWLVPPGDAAALAQALGEALAMEKPARAAMAAASRRHVAEHFTVERMCQATLDVYSQVLDRNRRQ